LSLGDFDWERLQVMVQRSVVFGVVGEVKTLYSKKRMPLDPALAIGRQSFSHSIRVVRKPAKIPQHPHRENSGAELLSAVR
jgi:hypothetical protein